MNCYKRQILLALSLLVMGAVGCSDNDCTEQISVLPNDELCEVRVATNMSATRTALLEDGVTTRWSTGDKIALWAEIDDALSLTAQSFQLYLYTDEYQKAYFTSVVPAMQSGSYNYYGCYPLPESVSGKLANFTVPQVQNGSSDLSSAIMLATPAVGGALTDGGDEQVELSFRHKLHVLKITIPESKNYMGEGIDRLEITFPVDVVGGVSLDVSNPDAELTFTSGNKTLVIDPEEPIDEGDTLFAVIAPVDATDGVISFKGYTAEQETEVIYTSGKLFEAEHTTPIKLSIPHLRKITYVTFSIGENNLGEAPTSFTVTAPSGVTFPDGSSSKSFQTDSSNSYTFAYEGECNTLSNTAFTVNYDSPNANVTGSVSFSITPYRRNSVSLTVPYLLYEDFNSILAESESYGNNSYDSSDRNQPGKSLDGAMPTNGWNAARYWLKSGSCRVNARYQATLAWASTHYGRLDTPPLSQYGLKSGANVKLKVWFDAGNYTHSSSTNDAKSGSYAYISLATHTNQTNPIDGIPMGKTGISSEYDTSLADYGTTHYTSAAMSNQYGADDFNNSYPTHTVETVTTVGSSTRLCFYPSTSYSKLSIATNAEFNFYIDNIRVSIAQ